MIVKDEMQQLACIATISDKNDLVTRHVYKILHQTTMEVRVSMGKI